MIGTQRFFADGQRSCPRLLGRNRIARQEGDVASQLHCEHHIWMIRCDATLNRQSPIGWRDGSRVLAGLSMQHSDQLECPGERERRIGRSTFANSLRLIERGE